MEVPKPVIDFFSNFQRSINEKKAAEIQHAYEELPAIIAAFFTNQLLPPVEILGQHVEIIGIFELLYDQLRYRLLFARREATKEEFHESYFMHFKLFGFILKDDLSRQIFLPKQWIWDILDSFVFQFTQYMQFEAASLEIKEPDQKPVWKPSYMFQTLSELVQTARFFKSPYHQMLKLFGIYSSIQLLKLNAIFGDFYLALKSIEEIDSEQEAMMVYDCKASYYFYAAFSSMLSREYQQSIRYCILFLNGLYKKDLNPSFDFTLQNKNYETKIKYILAISFVLFPSRLDENTTNQLRDYVGELISNMNNGNLDSFMTCFNEIYRDFIEITPDYKKSRIREIFMEEMKQCLIMPMVRGIIKLYSTLPLPKMAQMLNKTEDEVKTLLLLFKQKNKEIKSACKTDDLTVLAETSVLSPYLQVQPLPDYDFCLDKEDMLNTFDTKIERKLGDYLLKQILRFDEITKNLKRVKI